MSGGYLTASVIAQARYMGVYGQTTARLARMLKRSVPVRGDRSKRKYLQFVFQFVNQSDISVLKSIARTDWLD